MQARPNPSSDSPPWISPSEPTHADVATASRFLKRALSLDASDEQVAKAALYQWEVISGEMDAGLGRRTCVHGTSTSPTVPHAGIPFPDDNGHA